MGDVVAVRMFFVGTLKGMGKVCLQSVLDCFSGHAWGRLYTSKLPLTAVQIMNNDVLLPFLEEHGIRDPHGPLRQRAGVLRPAGPASL